MAPTPHMIPYHVLIKFFLLNPKVSEVLMISNHHWAPLFGILRRSPLRMRALQRTWPSAERGQERSDIPTAGRRVWVACITCRLSSLTPCACNLRKYGWLYNRPLQCNKLFNKLEGQSHGGNPSYHFYQGLFSLKGIMLSGDFMENAICCMFYTFKWVAAQNT